MLLNACHGLLFDCFEAYVEYLLSAFLSERFLESAEAYAKTCASFEEVALKFVSLEKKDALRYFLLLKLDNLKSQVCL